MKKKIVIVGGGFAAISAAEEIVRNNGGSVEVTLISGSNSLFLYPALVPYVFGNFERTDLSVDLREKLAEHDIRFVHGKVSSIDAASKTVRSIGADRDEEIPYDLLLIATGRQFDRDAVPGFSDYAQHILDPDAADRLRTKIRDFSEGSIVVGLCPGGTLPIPACEAALAFALRSQTEIADGRVSVTAVFPGSMDEAFRGANLFRDLAAEFGRKGIFLQEHFPIEVVKAGKIIDAQGNAISYDLLMLIPPFVGPYGISGLEPYSDLEGFIRVDDHLRVEGAKGIYAAGDIISLDGPRFGYMAIRQGKIAGQNLLREAKGEAVFAAYEHSIAWAIGEKYTDPVFFHYGFWDESLDDFDPGIMFGLVRAIRDKYGPIKGFGKSLGTPG